MARKNRGSGSAALEPVLDWKAGSLTEVANTDAIVGMASADKTMVTVFTTGTDVTTRQVIFEQGGAGAGFNLFIEDGKLYANVWGDTTGWSYQELSVDVSAGMTCEVALVLDGASDTSGSFALIVGGEPVGYLSDVGTLGAHSDAIGIGRTVWNTQIHGKLASSDDAFLGVLSSVQEYNIATDYGQSALALLVEQPVPTNASYSFTEAAPTYVWTSDMPKRLGLDVAITGSVFEVKTQVARITTGADVTSLQTIYEQGGAANGLNIFIEGGRLYASVWALDAGGWGWCEVSTELSASKQAEIAFVIDGAADASGTATLYVDGVAVASSDGVGLLFAHTDKIGIGSVAWNTVIHGESIRSGGRFAGDIDYLAQYNASPDMPEVNYETVTTEDPITVDVPDVAVETPYTAADWLFKGISMDYGRRDAALQGEAQHALDEVFDINAGAVAVVARYRVADGQSSDVYSDAYYTESLENIERAVKDSQARGLDVMIKPHIVSADGTPSFSITPDAPSAFFADYKAHLLDLAKIAEANGVRIFSLGNELGDLFGQDYSDYWIDIIADVREVYSGDLTIAAQFWQIDQIDYWDCLDFIGINGYVPLSETAVPSVQDIYDAWTSRDSLYGSKLGMSVVDYTRSVSDSWGTPVIFTEIGFRSIEGGAESPGDWSTAGVESEEAQANMLEGFLKAWGEQADWMQGSFLWGWNILQGQDNDYSPQDKLGEAIVASAFGDTDALSTATMIDGQTELVVRIAGKGPTGYTPELLVNVDGLNVTEFDVEAVRSAGEFDEFIFIVNDADVEHVSLYFDNPVSQSALYVDYIEVNNVRYEGEAAENHAVPEGYATSTFATMFTNGALVFEI